MAKIELAKSKDGRETIVRVNNPGNTPDRLQIRFGWIGTNRTLGPNGWEHAPNSFAPASARVGKDLVIKLESAITNHIPPGTPVEISLLGTNVAEQMIWPVQWQGPDRWEDVFPTPTPGDPATNKVDRAILEMAESQIADLREQIAKRDAELKAAYQAAEDARNAKPTGEPLSLAPTVETHAETPKLHRWGLVAISFLVGLGLGVAGKYAYERYGPQGDIPSTAFLEQQISELRAQIDALQKVAFTPLNGDITRVADRSPKGVVPEVRDEADANRVSKTFFTRGINAAAEASPNMPEAIYWYKRTVKLCEKDAIENLGYSYLKGDGVSKDTTTGFQLMRCASALGSIEAPDVIRDLIKRGDVPLAPPAIGDLYQSRPR